MKKLTFNYLGADCEYHHKNQNLHIISNNSFESPTNTRDPFISKEYNIKKEDVKTITFKHHHTKLPEHVHYYFNDYPKLQYIELSKLDFNNVKHINRFISFCPNLEDITIVNKEAKKLITIKNFIGVVSNVKNIILKQINAPNLNEIKSLIFYIKGNIETILIEDITAPNINTLEYLMDDVYINALDLRNIGGVKINKIEKLINNCQILEEININILNNTTQVDQFIENTPILKTNIIKSLHKINHLDIFFLSKTPKNGYLDLNKFENIKDLYHHLKRNLDIYPYSGIKIGKHNINLNTYILILNNNIPILDKTAKEIVNNIIKQAQSTTKENIDEFLYKLENKKYQGKLIEKLNIIKNLK